MRPGVAGSRGKVSIPGVVTYEDVVADPHHVVQGLLDSLGVEDVLRRRSRGRRDGLRADQVSTRRVS